jgi:hypothetical protein
VAIQEGGKEGQGRARRGDRGAGGARQARERRGGVREDKGEREVQGRGEGL